MEYDALRFADPELGARLSYHPGFLEAGTADALLAWMLEHAPWQREAPVIFGVAREVRRRTCAFGEVGRSYRYSGLVRAAEPWPELLVPVVERVREHCATSFDFALANHYADGEVALGKHADDERDIVESSAIAGLSLGAERDFVLYRKGKGGERVATVALAHGSLVVMWGTMQRHFVHAVPSRKRVHAPRVSLTFRAMA
jgi:alkylated DNA repair dioxygenase AlkB